MILFWSHILCVLMEKLAISFPWQDASVIRAPGKFKQNAQIDESICHFLSSKCFTIINWLFMVYSVNIQIDLRGVYIKLYLQDHANWKELHVFTHKEINDFLINCLIKTKNLDVAENSWLEKLSLMQHLYKKQGCTRNRKQSCKIHFTNQQTTLSNNTEHLCVFCSQRI